MTLTRRETLLGLGASPSLVGYAPGQDNVNLTAANQAVPRWSIGPDLPIRVQEIYPAVLDGVLYVAGGLSPDTGLNDRIGISDRVFALTPGADRWSERAHLPQPLHHPNLVSLEGSIYAVGGFTATGGDAWTMTAGVQVYDPRLDAWRDGPDMPQPFAETVAASLNGRLHLVTGRRPAGLTNRSWSDHADTNAHIMLDPVDRTWVTLRPAPTARNSAAGAVLDSALHVVGGRTVSGGNTPVHESYDPESDLWTRRAPLPRPETGPSGVGGLALAALHGALYAFGGEWFDNSGGGVYSQIWRYDPKADQWREVGRMPTPRHGLGAVTVQDAIWTLGGAARAGGNATSAAAEMFTP